MTADGREMADRERSGGLPFPGDGPYESLFSKNMSVMLLIDPDDGRILGANPAACAFYGYGESQLKRMKISDINQQPTREVKAEMKLAKHVICNTFQSRHRLATGEVRDVEVFSSPIETAGGTILHSIIHDVSERKRAEEELEVTNVVLQRKNIALSELVALVGQEEATTEQRIRRNIEFVVLPIVGMLRARVDQRNESVVDVLEQSLNLVVSERRDGHLDPRLGLSGREIEVCNLIRLGLQSKEIARFLNISLRGVESHRGNIRRKLKIDGSGTNLSVYLRTM